MQQGRTGIGDLSTNKYAAATRELAEGLAAWSGFLLFFFYLFQLITNERAHFFSFKALLLITLGEIAFVLLSRTANALVALLSAALLVPLAAGGRVQSVQNIQSTWLAIFGLGLCVAAWFFADLTTAYMFS